MDVTYCLTNIIKEKFDEDILLLCLILLPESLSIFVRLQNCKFSNVARSATLQYYQ